jgi:AmmeMemoRadiSam system protein B
MAEVRSPAVAGSFYPRDAKTLRLTVRDHLETERGNVRSGASWPKALIVPHAGYVYSGPIAARAYLALEPGAEVVRRVVLVGPSHHVGFEGLAVPTCRAFATGLGAVPIDESARELVLSLPFVHSRDDAHRQEHSVEVQLPFLQEVLDRFFVLPIVVGRATGEQVAEALDLVWGGQETVIVISSDLSHFLDYETAKRRDAATAVAIERLEPEHIGYEDACGCIGVQGILRAAAAHGLDVDRLDLRSSGDTAGGRRDVVGYGAWALTARGNAAT